MLRVCLEIDGEVRRQWEVEANDYVATNATAGITYFGEGQEHVHLFDGSSLYRNYTYNRIDNNVLDGCSGHIDTGNTTYLIASQNTSGETVHLVTTGWASSTAHITVICTQAPIIGQYAFGIQAGYNEE